VNYKLICVGGLKEKYLASAENEYFKRISGYGNITVTELKEARLLKSPGAGSAAAEAEVIRAEGEKILKSLDSVNRNNNYVIVLDRAGKDLSSEEFAAKLRELALGGTGCAVFVTGGSLGLAEEVKKSADYILSFGKKTYPHQLMRIILEEQIYRACKINAGETYHK
jgi:23S rRNA (pseudouridine1915-N3)-methyltransferase